MAHPFKICPPASQKPMPRDSHSRIRSSAWTVTAAGSPRPWATTRPAHWIWARPKGWAACGAALTRPYCLALLAQAQARRDRLDEALRVVGEALETAQRTGERWYEAELQRLRAVLLLQTGNSETDEAEAGLRRALALAREQGAHALELRAAVSLAGFWGAQGGRSKALDLLQPVYGGFTKGLDMADLRAALALLDALAEGVEVTGR
jgi:predicted ATPase